MLRTTRTTPKHHPPPTAHARAGGESALSMRTQRWERQGLKQSFRISLGIQKRIRPLLDCKHCFDNPVVADGTLKYSKSRRYFVTLCGTDDLE